MVQKGIQGFLAYMQDMNIEVLKMEQVSIVKEFIGVLPNDLLGLPPSREIEFCIDLVSSTKLILMASYRIKLVELKELKE